jgi:C-terminal processing protease CtpA/Prc
MNLQFIPGCMLAVTLLVTSCHKTNDGASNDTPLPVTPTTGSTLELSMDSLYLYASQTYLWYDALPSYTSFNPRQYTSYSSSDLQDLKKELFVLSQYKINPATGNPYEYSGSSIQAKYSFIEEQSTTGQTGQLGTVTLEGKGNDLGLELSVVNGQSLWIRYVNPGSPAALAGLTRACRITLMNNAAVSVNAATVNSALAQSSLPLTVEKPDGSMMSVTLVKASYTSIPVLKTAVFTSGTKKIGYIAFIRFSSLANAQTALTNACADFATAGVTDMVVDLRYNGGGYVQTAEYFANLLGPASATGSVMYKETFNTLMQQGKASILKSLPYLDADKKPVYRNGVAATYADVDYSIAGNTNKFDKKGNLQKLSNIVFIVSGSTASASELLLNSLKPYATVKLVGAKTYGKPVGFFGININKYTVYMSQFTSVNANNEGYYYDGITPDIAGADDVTHDFGDAREICLSKALSYITNGAIPAYGRVMVNGRSAEAAELTVSATRGNEFNGMVEQRTHLR